MVYFKYKKLCRGRDLHPQVRSGTLGPKPSAFAGFATPAFCRPVGLGNRFSFRDNYYPTLCFIGLPVKSLPLYGGGIHTTSRAYEDMRSNYFGPSMLGTFSSFFLYITGRVLAGEIISNSFLRAKRANAKEAVKQLCLVNPKLKSRRVKNAKHKKK